ncbi:MAG: hypothetical protein JSS25_00750 [Proteobacteria bacterium]|nr:hypothetical protein [Pseudomonadota bacterium]
MKTVSGVLQTVGESRSNKSQVYYSYIEIGGEMLKKVVTFRGLNGKLRAELGNHITLYLNGDFLVALEASNGKTYCTEKASSQMTKAVIFLIAGIILTIVLFPAGILFGGILGFVALMLWSGASRVNSGSSIPGAIEVPRDSF